MSEKFQKFILSVVGVLVMSFLGGYLIFAWTEPSQNPPQGNVPAPINVGPQGQAKQGGLILNTGGASTGLIVQYGNVGIGTTAPGEKLDVAGNINLSSETAKIMASKITTTTQTSIITGQCSYIEGTCQCQDAPPCPPGCVETFQLRGNCGLGNYELYGSNVGGRCRWVEGNQCVQFRRCECTRTSYTRTFYPINISDTLFIQPNNGNVGIGTTAPGAKLDIVSGSQRIQFLTGTNTSGYIFQIGVNDDGVNLSTNSGIRGFNFKNPNGTLLTIASNGNVGIGTTAPASPLHVKGTGHQLLTLERSVNTVGYGAGWHARLLDSASNVHDYAAMYGIIQANTDGAEKGALVFYTANPSLAEKMRITAEGNVGIGTTAPGYKLDVAGSVGANAYYYRSDIKLKENVSEIKDALEKILKLQGVNFTWKGNGEKSIGLIAQDVEKIFPELVNTDNSGMKYIDYGRLTAILIEGIKEQQKEIELLKQEIENLKIQIKGQ
jgi:hypothetical protein